METIRTEGVSQWSSTFPVHKEPGSHISNTTKVRRRKINK